MTNADLHPLFQQMGEVLSGIESLKETSKLRQAQSEQLYELLRGDLSNLRTDQQDLEEKMDCVVCVVQNDLDRLRSDTRDNMKSVEALIEVIETLRRPLADITALRSRVAGFVFSIGIVGSAAVWLAEPVYRYFVQDRLGSP